MHPVYHNSLFPEQSLSAALPPTISTGMALCPACTGRLVLLRDFFRCVRCGFCICTGCEDMPEICRSEDPMR
jgi:hypothetical protein